MLLHFQMTTVFTQVGTPDFRWRGWWKDFLGFEILDSGICLGRKTWQLLFFLEGGGGWFTSGFFLRIQKNLMSLCIMLLMKHKMFLGVSSFENSAWDIFFVGGGGGGLLFSPGIFSVLLETLGTLVDFWFLPPFDHPRHLKIRSTPLCLLIV